MRSILAAAFFLYAYNAYAAEAPKPNIVFILTDDLGYTDVACFGSFEMSGIFQGSDPLAIYPSLSRITGVIC